jgi:hypothetical protein
MITKLTSSELAKIGERQRASYLVPQAGYTLGIAAADGAALAGLLPAGFLDEVTRVRDEVDKARQDKTIMAVEAKQATGSQQTLVRQVKVWRRQIATRAQRALLAGASVPAALAQMGRSQAVPAVLDETSKTLALLTEHAAALDAVGPATQPLIDAGNGLYQSLDQADSTQEQARARDLPVAVAAFYAKKGELYIGLKIINEAGHELYANDAQAAARYNLSILYRRHSAAEPAPAPTPSTPTAAASRA